MKTISPYHTALLFVALSPFISGDAPVVCPADCSKCPTNGAYSVSGNMYYCTDQKQCPCNLAGSGCPILCSQCPLGNFDTKDMGGGIELTFCVDMVGESACSCISPPLAPLVPVKFVLPLYFSESGLTLPQCGFWLGWNSLYTIPETRSRCYRPNAGWGLPSGCSHV